MRYDIAVVIGRFQLPHKGHFQLIHQALEIADRVIIGLGSSNVRRSLRNPFNAEQRISLIQSGTNFVKDAVRSDRISFVDLEDSVYSDQWWVEHVQRKIQTRVSRCTPRNQTWVVGGSKPKIALVGHKKDDSSYYLDMFPQWDFVGVEQTNVISATQCREMYYKYGILDKSVHNMLTHYTTFGVIEALAYVPEQTYQELKARHEFVENYKEQWGYGPHYTADAVVVKSGHVLLIQRGQEPDIGVWAFPGGFINYEEPHLNAAIRECKEETGLALSKNYHRDVGFYNKSHRDDRGDIKTHAHLFDLGFGELPEVQGGDDAAHAEWVPIADLRADNMYGDHYFILRDLIRKI
jgi:bifunctional NMN adenylyltransferase/nudix hydrolase